VTTTYEQLNEYHRFRIATFMHAVFNLNGMDRDALKKAADDCAAWYYTDTAAVVRVWCDAWPVDLRVEIDNQNERTATA